MPEKELLMPYEATAELLDQFQGMHPLNSLESLVAMGAPLVEAARQVTESMANTFCSSLPALGQQTEYLTSWHSSLRADCSAEFTLQQGLNPSLSREVLNQARELQLLNGIRRGVRSAMIKSHKLASRKW